MKNMNTFNYIGVFIFILLCCPVLVQFMRVKLNRLNQDALRIETNADSNTIAIGYGAMENMQTGGPKINPIYVTKLPYMATNKMIDGTFIFIKNNSTLFKLLRPIQNGEQIKEDDLIEIKWK